jgi:hypothetical protein
VCVCSSSILNADVLFFKSIMLFDLLKAGFIFLLSVCLGADDIRILQPRVAHPFPQVHYECWSYFHCHEVSAIISGCYINVGRL